ncbi:MAG: hypothetical protein ACREHD_11815 [Pirellulales bacterium]
MRCLNMTRFVAAAVLACAVAPADAAESANPTGFMYYGYGQGSFGYPGAGYAPSTAGYGAAAMPAGYSGYGYGYSSGPAYPGYGYGYGGYGGYGYGGGGGPHARRHHHCSFGGNCNCCNSVWDGYTGCADGACCGAPVKVHRRHRALGCGAGPCVDASCGAPAARRHHCLLRRRNGCDNGACYSLGGAAGMAAPGMMYDGGSAQPTMANPDTGEQVQPPPSPSYGNEEPMPGDDSST